MRQVTLSMMMLWLTSVGLEAATLTTIHSLNIGAYGGALDVFTNYDGTQPETSLLLSGNTLYGTAFSGGINGFGTVFKLNIDGSGFTVLHPFTAPPDESTFTNSDGYNPRSSLVLSSNILYGTTSAGGPSGDGTIFAVHRDGSGFTNLYVFTGYPKGASPEAGLLLSGYTLYGTTKAGGNLILYGTVFRINTDGTAFTNLWNFSLGNPNHTGTLTNYDGQEPFGDLVMSGNVLYGTTFLGGTNGSGAIFRINTDGTAFTNIHNFAGVVTDASEDITNSDGANPRAGLVLSGNTLYGTTYDGGTNASGTVFKVNTDGTGFSNLWNFSNFNTTKTNYVGEGPEGSLVLSGSRLYGTTSGSMNLGYPGEGTAFSITTNGTGFTELSYIYGDGTGHGTNALGPYAGLAVGGNILYGTTFFGGSINNGTVFALNAGIPLNAQINGGKLILSWTNTTFLLQTNATLNNSFSNVMGATSPYTNTSAATQQFFRLQAN